MARFKIGEKVRVINGYLPEFDGRVGVITEQGDQSRSWD